ncbi:hypothetical protein Pen01_71090 [Phytomonospora endophytica]|nr:hypothetical protein Pen01_71090 [Phytomonospora endophytica]
MSNHPVKAAEATAAPSGKRAEGPEAKPRSGASRIASEASQTSTGSNPKSAHNARPQRLRVCVGGECVPAGVPCGWLRACGPA